MKSSAKNIKLASVDDLFSTEESRADETRERIIEIPLTELRPFKDHPFKVIDNEAMFDTQYWKNLNRLSLSWETPTN